MMERWQAAVEAVGLPTMVAIFVVVVVLLAAAIVLLRRRRLQTRGAAPPDRSDVEVPSGLRPGLAKTRSGVWQRLWPLLGRQRLDAEAVETLEAVLLGSDVGVGVTERLIARLQDAPGEA